MHRGMRVLLATGCLVVVANGQPGFLDNKIGGSLFGGSKDDDDMNSDAMKKAFSHLGKMAKPDLGQLKGMFNSKDFDKVKNVFGKMNTHEFENKMKEFKMPNFHAKPTHQTPPKKTDPPKKWEHSQTVTHPPAQKKQHHQWPAHGDKWHAKETKPQEMTEPTTPMTGTTPADDHDDGTADPVDGTADPVDETADPVDETADPVDETADPVDETADPVDETADPVDETADPVDETADPVDGTADPVNE